jgi:hypothetical protein
MLWGALGFLVAAAVVWVLYEVAGFAVGNLLLRTKRSLDGRELRGAARWAARLVDFLVRLTHRPCARCAELNWRAAARCRRCGLDLRDVAA